MLHHLNIFFDLSSLPNYVYLIFFKIAFAGEIGVDIFFVISGFLISGLLYPDLNSEIRIKRFYTRRFFKIIPQYLIATLTAILALNLIKPFVVNYIDFNYVRHAWRINTFSSHNDASVWSHIFFYQNFTSSIGILGHTWSLAIEEHFYLFFPLLLTFVNKARTTIKAKKQLLLIIFLILIFIAFLIKLYYLKIKVLAPILYTQYRYDALIFGCLLRLLEPKFPKIPFREWKFFSAFCLTAGAGIFISFIIFGFNKTALFSYMLAYLASGLLIIAFIQEQSVPFRLDFLTRNNTLRWIGKNSYGIYLWHYIIIYSFVGLRDVFPDLVVALLCLISVIFAGFLSTITIEKFFLNVRNKFSP